MPRVLLRPLTGLIFSCVLGLSLGSSYAAHAAPPNTTPAGLAQTVRDAAVCVWNAVYRTEFGNNLADRLRAITRAFAAKPTGPVTLLMKPPEGLNWVVDVHARLSYAHRGNRVFFRKADGKVWEISSPPLIESIEARIDELGAHPPDQPLDDLPPPADPGPSVLADLPKVERIVDPDGPDMTPEKLIELVKSGRTVDEYTEDIKKYGPLLIKAHAEIDTFRGEVVKLGDEQAALRRAINLEYDSVAPDQAKIKGWEASIEEAKHAQAKAEADLVAAIAKGHELSAAVGERSLLRDLKVLVDNDAVEIEQVFVNGKGANALEVDSGPHDEKALAVRVKLKKKLQLCRGYGGHSWSSQSGGYWGGCPAVTYLGRAMLTALQATPWINHYTNFVREQFLEGDDFVISVIGPQTSKEYGQYNAGGTVQYHRMVRVRVPGTDEVIPVPGARRLVNDNPNVIRDVETVEGRWERERDFQRGLREVQTEAQLTSALHQYETEIRPELDSRINALSRRRQVHDATPPLRKDFKDALEFTRAIEKWQREHNDINTEQAEYARDRSVLERELAEISLRARLVARGLSPGMAYVRANAAVRAARDDLSRIQIGLAPHTIDTLVAKLEQVLATPGRVPDTPPDILEAVPTVGTLHF